MDITARYNEDGSIIASIDGLQMSVPDNPSNLQRKRIAEWEAAGNTIEPYGPPVPTVEDYRAAIQAHVDAVAQERQYDDGASCASYKDSTNAAWAAEAAAFIAWRDAVWVYAFAELAKVQDGQREQPTASAFVAELPEIQWPPLATGD